MSEQKIIKQRVYGQDCDFLSWVRAHPDLPSRVGETRLSVQDVDVLFHAYMMAIDRQGSREAQALMIVEAKTRNGEPDDAQRDTLWKLNHFAAQRQVDNQAVRFFGVFVLRFSVTSPANSERMLWGRFGKTGSIFYEPIDERKLIDLLLFRVHPVNMTRHAFRRHHKTQELAVQTIAELGFPVFERIVKRS